MEQEDREFVLDDDITEAISKLLDEKLEPIFDKLNTLQESLDYLYAQFDDIDVRVTNVDSTVNSFHYGVQIQSLTNELNQLKKSMNDLEQYSRRDCLEIHGVPATDKENTSEIVVNVAKLLNVDLKPDDISVSHRLGTRKSDSGKQQTPGIIVKLTRRELREKLYSARKHLRDKTTNDIGYTRIAPQKLFINESLTSSNQKLFSSCLKAKREYGYKFLWTNYGKILMRKDGSSPVVNIRNEIDLNHRIKNDYGDTYR